MSRLPTPGQDDNAWGNILNDFLVQAHTTDGTIKSNSVGTTQLQTSFVTTEQLALGSVVTPAIANNAITEAKLDIGVQTKLNTSTVADATASTKGILQLTGDLSGTADMPTVPGLTGKADQATTYTKTEVDTGLSGKADNVHTHNASQVTDLTQATQDTIGSSITAGTNVTVTHDNTSGATTIAAIPGAGVTDLSTTTAANDVTVVSSTGDDATLPAATTSDAGVLSSSDKTKLNGVATSATANSNDSTLLDRANHTGTQTISTVTNLQATLDGKESTLPTGSIADYYRVDKSWQTLDKTAVGLANVDNTTDLNKPVSTATQTVLDTKATTTALGDKADTIHSHVIADTTGLQAALDAKQATGSYAAATHTHVVDDITNASTVGKSVLTAADAPTARVTIGAGTSNLVIGSTSTTAKAGDYAPAWTEVTSKPTTFTPAAHVHIINDVTNLQTSLDGKAAISHTHVIADTTNLQTSLNAKANQSTTYTKTEVDTALSSKVDTASLGWQSFTPIWNGVTMGTAVSQGRYCRVGDTVHAIFSLNIGSGTVLTGSSIYPSLPVATAAVVSLFSGPGWAFDNSTSAWSQVTLVPGTYILTPTSGRVGSAVPWTWAANDLMRFSLTYEVA